MKCDEGVGSTYHTQIPETLQVIPVPLVSAHSQHDNSPNVHVKRESNKVLAVKRAEVPNANHELCVIVSSRAAFKVHQRTLTSEVKFTAAVSV